MIPMHLRSVPPPSETFDHITFMRYLFSYFKPERYLELGVRFGTSFNHLADFCTEAIGVDVIPPKFDLKDNMLYFQMSTDEFFDQIKPKPDIFFDVVFIDADHSHEQSLKDFMNVKDLVIEDGIIFMHDTYPYDEKYMTTEYCNDCYRTPLYIKNNLIDDFEVFTLSINPGLTMIKKLKRNKQVIYFDK